MAKLPPTVCPHARYVSTEESDPKIVCGIKEADEARGDRILEGSPTGVIVSARDDPATFFGWCTGEGAPQLSPDGPLTQHYSCCPIYGAGVEIKQAKDRLFGEMKDRAEAERSLQVAGLGPQTELDPDEKAWFQETLS